MPVSKLATERYVAVLQGKVFETVVYEDNHIFRYKFEYNTLLNLKSPISEIETDVKTMF